MGQIKNYSRFRKWGWWKKSSPRRPTIIFSINLTEFYYLNVYHYGFKIQSLTWTYHCRFQNLQPALFFSFFSFLFVYVSVFFFSFSKQKIYILIQSWLCGWASDKKKFTRLISGNKTTFFALVSGMYILNEVCYLTASIAATLFSMVVSLSHRSTWSDPNVKDTVFINIHIIKSGLWLIRENLTD